MLRIKSFAVSLIPIVLVFSSPVHADSGYATKDIAAAAKYKDAGDLLEMLKWPNHADDAFDARLAPHWDLNAVARYFSSDGITFTDMNDSSNIHISKKEIIEELRARKGRAFLAIAHLSFLYSIPNEQGTKLTFTDVANGFNVEMPGLYALGFKNVGDIAYLESVNYEQLEGD